MIYRGTNIEIKNVRKQRGLLWLRRIVLMGCFAGYCLQAWAQGSYTNDWIDFDQPYYKLSVAQDGIYKVTYHELTAAGFPIEGDPRNIQLFHRGVEQAIAIEGEQDGSFDAADYILFYGKKNDGTLDQQLYVSPDAQPHNYYNLYSDTSAYFLTIGSNAGKRMNSLSESPVGLPNRLYHEEEKLVLYTQNYWAGREYSLDTYLSQYDYGEGWTGTSFRDGNSRDVVFNNITHRYVAGKRPELEMVLTGRNANMHNVEIMVGPSVGTLRTLSQVQFSGHESKRVSFVIEWSDISAEGQFVVRVSVQSTGVTDYISIAAVKLRFSQQPNMDGEIAKVFNVREITTKSQFVINDVQGVPVIFDITNSNNVGKLGYTNSGGAITTVLPTAGNRVLWVGNDSGYLSVPAVKKVTFQQIAPAMYDFLIISNKTLRVPVSGVGDPVQAYAMYRSSPEGGGYKPFIVEIHQLFDQFNYGEPSPLAIREFARFMVNNGDPAYLFLIGKGLSVNYRYYRNGPVGGRYHDLVPTIGLPGSDAELTAGLDINNPRVSAIPTGRLTAERPEDVVAYLNKVKEVEAAPYDALWRKRLIHLSGGATEQELIAFRNYVNGFKSVAEGHYLGGQVTTKSKQTNNAVELINIAEEVNAGVSLITFFGHSGPATTDLEIGNVSEDIQGYRNKGKYPFILVNGCDAGNIYADVYTFGEDWIVTPDRGAVGFIAHVALGLSSNLKRYSDLFYATAFSDPSYINQSIGKIMHKVSVEYLSKYGTSPASISQIQQMNLQGDPALRIFGAQKPDFEITSDHMELKSVDGGNITALSDSFNLSFVVRNFGITTQDSLHVQLRRKLDNGTYLYIDSVYAPVLFSDTLNFVVKNLSEYDNYGNNEFEITLDYINRTEELDETNNVATIDFFIPKGGTSNLHPFNFAIINHGDLELICQSNDVLVGPRTFVFQIDTARSFNSPAFRQHTVLAEGLASWKPPLIESLANDSIAYYWRTKFADSRPGEDTTWAESSFVYIADSPEGWAQTHFFQYSTNEKVGLKPNDLRRELEFLTNENAIRVVTYGDLNDKGHLDMEVFVNNIPLIVTSGFKVCRDNALGAIAFDRSSTEPYLLFDKTTWSDPIACGRSPFVINNFSSQDIINDNRLNNYLNAVHEGDYVLVFSFGSNAYTTWPESAKDALLTIGASASVLDNLQNGQPYILLGKKGGSAIAELTGDRDAEIALEETIVGRYNRGVLVSPKIGPAKSWGSLFTKARFSETPANDVLYYDVIGMDMRNNETVLFSNITAEELSLEHIDAGHYPMIKLKMHVEDMADLTPPQLKNWLVLYESVPEGVLLMDKEYLPTLPSITLIEGETAGVGYAFHNISKKDFEDSLTVSYATFNTASRVTEEKHMKIGPLAASDTAKFVVPLITENKSGKYNLKVNVNPRILPEQQYDNNVIDIREYLEIKSDHEHPILDVSFDGQYIMDGDIVSPDPLINIVMKDNGPFLKKKDTVGVEIMLKRPCEGCMYERINFSSPQLVWTPATESSDFKVEYRPGTLADGLYGLKVQAADVSGNLSGTKPYNIHFEVINESTITHFYPYPNPFSTSTRFVFTLTGKEIPDQIKIQIMTVTGKVVREITQHELGPLKIGNNISDFSWNGTDEFGDQLANGVYLYRVIIGNNGTKMKHRRTSADKAFKHGYGKMYLLR